MLASFAKNLPPPKHALTYFQGIDTDGYGLSMSEAAMNKLTNGQAVQLGRIDAQVEVVQNPPNAYGQ